MPRIAVICVHTSPLAMPGSQDSGGMNTYVRELSRQLGLRGNNIDVFTRRDSPSTPNVIVLPGGERVVHVKAGPSAVLSKREVFGYLPEYMRGVEAFRLADGARYDLIHSHYWLSGWVGEELKRVWKIPHVTMFHTLSAAKSSVDSGISDSVFRRDTEARVAAEADVVVAASHHEKGLIKHICGESDRRIEVIPCGVDLDLFQPRDRGMAKKELGVVGKRVILFVGRLVELKGVDILIEAAGRLSSRRDLQVIIVGGEGGTDPEIQRLRWLAEELELDACIRFDGPVDHIRLPIYYNAADVCVVPSHYESFGLVAIEALACGTPVVASRVGGLPSIVHEGQNGLLVPWRCPQVFADRIETVLSDRDLYERLRGGARSSVSHLTWGQVAEHVESIYASLLVDARGMNEIANGRRKG